jgi:L-fucose isomerase-like protein
MDVKLRVGVVVTGEEALDKESPRRALKAALKRLDALDNIEKITFEETLSNSNVSKKASKYFSENNVDVLLIVAGTWTQDNFLIDALKFLNCPSICWVPPDPLGVGFPTTGALVGAIQNCGVLVRIGKKVKMILDGIESEKGFDKLKKYIKVLTLIKKLKFAKVGIIGSRVPGMLDSSFHELELMKQIGPEIVHIGTSDLAKEIDSVKDMEAEKVLKDLLSINQVKDVNKPALIESIKIYMAVKKFVKDYSLNALAIRCWPDLKNSNICAPCFTLSRLTDEGIMSACESDVTAAVSMYILNQLTGNTAYLSDMLKINNETREAMFYHCGAAATCLAQDKSKVEYKLHRDAGPGRAWKPGLVVEFTVKPGRFTFARIGEIESKYKMVTYAGNAVESDMFTIGNPAKVILDKNPEFIVNSLIGHGLAHHQIGVHGDINDDLISFCDFLNLDLFLL